MWTRVHVCGHVRKYTYNSGVRECLRRVRSTCPLANKPTSQKIVEDSTVRLFMTFEFRKWNFMYIFLP